MIDEISNCKSCYDYDDTWDCSKKSAYKIWKIK